MGDLASITYGDTPETRRARCRKCGDDDRRIGNAGLPGRWPRCPDFAGSRAHPGHSRRRRGCLLRGHRDRLDAGRRARRAVRPGPLQPGRDRHRRGLHAGHRPRRRHHRAADRPARPGGNRELTGAVGVELVAGPVGTAAPARPHLRRQAVRDPVVDAARRGRRTDRRAHPGLALGVRRRGAPRGRRAAAGTEGSAGPRSAQERQRGRVGAGLVVLGVSAALAAGAANALGAFLVDSSVERGLSEAAAGLTLTLGSALCVTGRLVVGWVADRWQRGHLAILAGLLAVGTVGLGLLAADSLVALVIGVMLAFGLGWCWPGLLAFAVVRLRPQAPAAATSVTQTGVYAGAAAGPLGFGVLVSHTSYGVAWLAAAIAEALAAMLVIVGARLA